MPYRVRSRALLLSALLLAMGPLSVSRAGAAEPPRVPCDPVEGLTPLLEPASVLLLGEMHGTAESPGFVVRAACLALRAGRSVTVALEIPVDEGQRVEAYLGSSGAEKDRAALLAGPFWRDAYQDGRRSLAMLELIDHLRRMRRQGNKVRVALLDVMVPPPDGHDRDWALAQNLKAAAEEAPQDVVVALTGNLHTRVVKGFGSRPGYEPMGYVLKQAKPEVKVTALNVAYTGGTAWYCDGSDAAACKGRDLQGALKEDKGVRVVRQPAPDGGYDGVYEVGQLHASEPAARRP